MQFTFQLYLYAQALIWSMIENGMAAMPFLSAKADGMTM